MNLESILIYSCITIFSFSLFIVSWVSYFRFKNPKLMFIGFAFLVFFIRGIILSLSVLEIEFINIITYPYFGLIDLSILIFLFIATLKR